MRYLLLLPLAASLFAQSSKTQIPAADWPMFNRNLAGTRYSPLTQINSHNVSELVPAWTFSMQRDGVPLRPSQSIPRVVNGIMYLSWPFNRVAAMESETGKVI